MTEPHPAKSVKRLGILTGGGDAPGLNAAVRAIVKAATLAGIEPVGLADGFDGLLAPDSARTLRICDVVNVLREGGTILGTSNRGWPHEAASPPEYVRQCLDGYRVLRLDALIVIGGEGSLVMARELHEHGLPLIVVPKTIDNDVPETAVTIGFDTAVAVATEAIDRLHTTAQAHHRVMVVEVMGRYAGWIALHAGIAGGADVILIPEVPYDARRVADRIRAREAFGARFSIVVAAEGAAERGAEHLVAMPATGGHAEKLGGIAEHVSRRIEALTGKESRSCVLGHVQRGGAPTSVDRILATRVGAFAVDLAQKGDWGLMTAVRGDVLVSVPLSRIAARCRSIPSDSDTIRAARQIGISFGD